MSSLRFHTGPFLLATILLCLVYSGCASQEKDFAGTAAGGFTADSIPDDPEDTLTTQNRFVCTQEWLESVVLTDTTYLDNGNFFYYEADCDSVRLALETSHGRKLLFVQDDLFLAGYNYRLGYQLEEEFDTHLLFRFGCPANGPCSWALVDKETGEETEVFEPILGWVDDPKWQLLISIDPTVEREDGRFDSLEIYEVPTGRRRHIENPARMDSCFYRSVIPTHCIDSVAARGDSLVLWSCTTCKVGWERVGEWKERTVQLWSR